MATLAAMVPPSPQSPARSDRGYHRARVALGLAYILTVTLLTYAAATGAISALLPTPTTPGGTALALCSTLAGVLTVALLLYALYRPFRPRTPDARRAHARLLEFVRAHLNTVLYDPTTAIEYRCLHKPPRIICVSHADLTVPTAGAEAVYTRTRYQFIPEVGMLHRLTEHRTLRCDAQGTLTTVLGQQLSPWRVVRHLLALRFSGRTGLGVVTAAEADDLLRQLTTAAMSR